MAKNQIVGFKDEYGFLSNFYNHTVKVNGLFFKNNVAAFLAQMYSNKNQQRYFTKLLPAAAIRFFEMTRINPPTDWDSKKEQIMYNICKNKFTNQRLREQLLATGDAELINESNFANDYWGKHDGQGENMLGKVLMRLRQEFKEHPPIEEEIAATMTDIETLVEEPSKDIKEEENAMKEENAGDEEANEAKEPVNNKEEKNSKKRKKKDANNTEATSTTDT